MINDRAKLKKQQKKNSIRLFFDGCPNFPDIEFRITFSTLLSIRPLLQTANCLAVGFDYGQPANDGVALLSAIP